MKLLALCLFVVLFQLSSVCCEKSDPVYEGENWVDLGGSFKIVCRIPMEEPFALEWTRNNETLDLSMENGYTIVDDVLESESLLVSVLNVRDAQPVHSGTYRCNKFSTQGHLVLVLTADEGDKDATIVHFEIGNPSLSLNCTLASHSKEVKWLKNGTVVQPVEGKVSIVNDDHTHYLTFTKPKVHDIGEYECQSDEETARFHVVMAPVVVKLSSSSNIVEGERFRLPCLVHGYPSPSVEWRKGAVKIDATERIYFKENAQGIPDSVLFIDEIKPDDRDDYMCFAENSHGSANSTTLVRVVDKYAALWPFLGICAEVIVLCTVIFIYERRRIKKDFDDADNETNNTKHAGNSKDSEVRHRK